jgi:hypothetical protein
MNGRCDWLCKNCRFHLGEVCDGVLQPLVIPDSIDARGLARLSCPRCATVKTWFPESQPAAGVSSAINTGKLLARRPG